LGTGFNFVFDFGIGVWEQSIFYFEMH
jgi:hypothetical protein